MILEDYKLRLVDDIRGVYIKIIESIMSTSEDLYIT